MAIPLSAAASLAGMSLIGNGISEYGKYRASKASAAELRKTANQNKKYATDQYEKQFGANTDEELFRKTGAHNLSELQNLIDSGKLYEGYGDYEGDMTFDPSSVDVTQDPGYAFRLKQGREALDASAASKGGMFSGAQQKALLEYGQELGSQEYQNAYQRQEGTFNNNAQRTYADYLTRLGQYNQNLRNQVSDLSGMVDRGERALGRQEMANENLTGRVLNANNTIGNANSIDAGAGWNALSGFAQGVTNGGMDIAKTYAMGGFSSAPTPEMDTTDFEGLTPGQQDAVLNMSGLNTSLYRQMNNPYTAPTNAPWTRGI